MVLEGVHLVPGLLPAELENALVSACVLQISDETAHAQHFFTRESGEDRPMAKYLDRFEEIRRLQRYIVGRAEREGVAGDREREREPRDARRSPSSCSPRQSARGSACDPDRDRAGSRADARAAGAVPVPVLSARDRACGAARRALARPRRPGGGGGGRRRRHAHDARHAADPGARRLRLGRRGGRPRAGRGARRGRRARSISRSTRSRAAASSRAAATARCR